jgi:nitronate monooxygenase
VEDGGVGYRCASEPLSVYVAKGGDPADAAGRKCVCNGLLANIGYQQVRNGRREEYGLITAGDDLFSVGEFLKPGRTEYFAADVVARLMTGCEAPQTVREEVCLA